MNAPVAFERYKPLLTVVLNGRAPTVLPDVPENRNVVLAAAKKSANADYKATLKSITATQAASVKTAYSDYATAVKACPKK